MPLILFNKPFRVLSQFTDAQGRPTLTDFIDESEVYPAGRLDFDSEGLLLLTDDGRLQARISAKRALAKRYRVQVEGAATPAHIEQITAGVELKDGLARALDANLIDEPEGLWPRNPPIRQRRSIPTSWIEVAIDEGRNRQVRRMTAAVGLPTLRLVRHRIGPWSLDDLASGETRTMSNEKAWQMLRSFCR